MVADKSQTKEVAWDDRFRESRGGWNAIGVNFGLEKNDEGKNILIGKTEWDAFDYIKEHAVDGMSLFVAGDIDFSTYKDKEGNVQHYTSLNAKKIYLKSKEIDFLSPDFKKISQFSQTIVFKGTHRDGETLYVDFGVIGWNQYNDASFEITPKLIEGMKSGGLKPFNSLTVTGNIINFHVVDEVSSNVYQELLTRSR